MLSLRRNYSDRHPAAVQLSSCSGGEREEEGRAREALEELLLRRQTTRSRLYFGAAELTEGPAYFPGSPEKLLHFPQAHVLYI